MSSQRQAGVSMGGDDGTISSHSLYPRVTCQTTWPILVLLVLPPPPPSLPSSVVDRNLKSMEMTTTMIGDSSSGASSCSGSSVSTSSSSATASSLVSRCGRERMVEVEMDAARALADFAKIALLEREKVGKGGSEWGNTGRRKTRKRIRNSDNTTNNNDSSSPDDKGTVETKAEEEGNLLTKGLELRPPCYLDLNQHATPEEEHNQQDTEEILKIEIQQKQMNYELMKPSPVRSTNRSSLGVGRGKSELTEAEKEAKRLRRVLANRESARQTIRRRQALCEDLTRKAAELALDNEKIKKERELALKEYLRLSDTNRQLKLKMAEKIKEEASTVLELETPPSSSTKYSLVMNQRSPFIQYPHPLSAGSLDLMKTYSNHELTNPNYEKGLVTSPMSTLHTPPPYMWFCPIIQQQGCSSVNTCPSSGTGVDTTVKELGSSSAAILEGRTPSSCQATHSSIDVKMDSELNQPPGRAQEFHQVTREQPTKHVLDAAVAANARRRRKELTKLKRRPWS